MLKILILLGISSLLYFGIFHSRDYDGDSLPSIQVNPILKSSSVDANTRAYKLQHAIRIPTISSKSYSHMKNISIFHEYLETAFPLLHSHSSISKTVINTGSIIYTWTPSSQDTVVTSDTQHLKPILLCAHMDVVNITETLQKSQWIMPPFGGDIENGYIWGRGTLDFKNGVIGILEAIEELLSVGYVPTREIHVALGHDEEIAGKQGAFHIARYFQSMNITFDFILDEGTPISYGLVPFKRNHVALVSVAEKGYIVGSLQLHSQPGHSSLASPDGTLLSTLFPRVLLDIDNGMLVTLPDTVLSMLKGIVPVLVKPLLTIFEFPIVQNVLFLTGGYRVIGKMMAKLWSMMATTFTVTMISGGGVGDNVVPGDVCFDFSMRLIHGDSVDNVKSVIQSALNKNGFSLIPSHSYKHDLKRWAILEISDSFNPSPISPINTSTFRWFKSVIYTFHSQYIRDVFHDSQDDGSSKIDVLSSLMMAGTDTKHYTHLSDNIYRFSPVIMTKSEVESIHGVNERIKVSDFSRYVEFFKLLIVNLPLN